MVKMDKVSDVLGSEGREALNACVKVKISGRPETQKYSREQALDRLRSCFEGVVSRPLLICQLESKDFFMLDKNGGTNREDIFDIFDIYDALVRCDELPYVEKYPRPGPRYDEIKKLIDKNRAAIEKQCQETTDNLQQYSWFVARRLVRDCFAGGFPKDGGLARDCFGYIHFSGRFPYDISLIYDSVCYWDIILAFPDLCAHARFKIEVFAKSQNRERIARYAEPPRNNSRDPGAKHRYGIALSLVDDEFPFKPCEDPDCRDSYNITDIHQAAEYLENKKTIYNLPEDDCPGSDVYGLKRLIDKCRTEVRKEYKKHRDCRADPKYSLFEVERRVRDCFSGPGPLETDVLLSKKGREEEVRVLKAKTYNIFEIKSEVDRLDSKKLGDLFQEGKYESNKEARDKINKEYEEASQRVEIDHGSGIIVHEHFVVTNKHVIEDVMNDASKEVSIFNAAIGECSCEVVHYDAEKDLALLCSKDGLNLEAKKIAPLQLSSQSLLPGMQISAFGFPMSHTGETALFVTGHVSGSKVNYSGQTFAVLNCALNGGNSGGPILCWVKGQLKVVGVAMQKHFKEILTLEERVKIEKIRESLQTSTIFGVSDEEIRSAASSSCDPSQIPVVLNLRIRSAKPFTRSSCTNQIPAVLYQERGSATPSSSDPRQIPLNLLTLKLYNALETHSQFNLSNAVPGRDVIDFIKDALGKYSDQHKEELSQILDWSD